MTQEQIEQLRKFIEFNLSQHLTAIVDMYEGQTGTEIAAIDIQLNRVRYVNGTSKFNLTAKLITEANNDER